MSLHDDDMTEDDLAADIDAALDASLPQREAPVDDGEQGDSRQYARDESGKFAKQEREEAEQAARDQGASPQQAKDAVAQGWRPPYWNDDAHTPWQTLPEQARQALEQRERAFATHLQGLAEKNKPLQGFSSVLETLSPHMDQLKAAGVAPEAFVGQLINAHQYLTKSPAEALLWLANTYQVSPADLYNQITQGGAQQQQQQDPAIQQVMQELHGLKSWKQTFEQQQQERAQQQEAEQEAALEAEIVEWAKDKPHFKAVQGIMAELVRGNPERGKSLDKLYQDACKLHPDVFERTQTDQRKASVTRARTAAASRGSPSFGGKAAISPKMSVEDTVRELLDGAV